MLYALVFIVIMVLYIFIRNPKSLYTIIFSLDFLSIFLLLFADVMYLIRLGNYQYTYQFEYIIYSAISKIPLSYFDIKIIINAAMILLLTASVMFIYVDIQNSKRPVLNIAFMLFLIISLSFGILYFNSPSFIERLYLKYTVSNGRRALTAGCVSAFNIGVAAFCFSPLIKLLYTIKHTRILLKQTHSKILLATKGIIYLIVFMMLVLTPISNLINNYNIYSFTRMTVNNTFIWISLTLALVLIAAVLFGRFDIFNEKLFHRTYGYKKTRVLTKDIRFVFHSYKNALFSIKLLSEKALANLGNEECETALERINMQTEALSEQINSFLNIYNQVYPNYNSVYIDECIESALKSVVIPENIRLSKDFSATRLMFFGDKSLITECFVNIISNSCDAIKQSGREDGRIRIETFSEKQYLCVSITDNGCGIDKKAKKKIFAPLYSTKQNHQNWGIGLAYTKNILLAHFGDVCFKSVPNSFTEFQVTLPLDNICQEMKV